jgi:DMSO/TMAO reductase YedYZ heme-binding membrane subunit
VSSGARQQHATRRLPPDRLWQPTTARWFYSIFGAALVYAVVRYHLAGDVAWAHFPLFIFNKAMSLAAVGFVASSYLVGKVFRWHDHDPRLRLVVIKFCGLMGFFMAGAHAFFSLCLWPPAYFGKCFEADGRMNLQGELAMALGIAGLFLLMGPALATLPMMAKAVGGVRWKRGQRLGYVTLALVSVHLVVLGLKGWMAPEAWPMSIPPISLVAVVLALVPLLVKKKLEHEKNLSQVAHEETE